jgi:hypothetical protein
MATARSVLMSVHSRRFNQLTRVPAISDDHQNFPGTLIYLGRA